MQLVRPRPRLPDSIIVFRLGQAQFVALVCRVLLLFQRQALLSSLGQLVSERIGELAQCRFFAGARALKDVA